MLLLFPFYYFYSFLIFGSYISNIYLNIKLCLINNKSMENIKLRRYTIYGLLGICSEIFWTGLESLLSSDYTMEGKTYIWMFFIYGLGVLLEPVHNKIRGRNILFRGVIYMLIIFCIELITGLLLKSFLGVCPWNYTDRQSLFGIITPSFIPVWFSVGLIFEKVHDLLDAIAYSIKKGS